MSVEIDPQELAFQRPFNAEVTQILKIKNPNRLPVAFKVKTTAPKQYCVRPNSGRIEPGKEVEVTVILQPMKQEPSLDIKCKDKFLVQSHTEEDKESVQEKKIRVVYTAAGSAQVSTPVKGGSNGLDGTHSSDNAPPAYTTRSPSPEQATYTPDNRAPATHPAVKLEDKPRDIKSLGDAKASAFNPANSSNLATTVKEAVPMSYDEMKAKLLEAQATIASYAQEGGIRMRQVAKGETGNKTVDDVAHRVQASQGVPLQIVAALCLVSFLLAYLFF